MIEQLLGKLRSRFSGRPPMNRARGGESEAKNQDQQRDTIHRGRRRLTKKQIEVGEHRQKVGGAWDEIGPLQLRFLRERGLLPHHMLLDFGCGALRGGVHFVRYLEAGNYHGIDIEPSLIEAGRWELEQAALAHKKAELLVSNRFEVERFGVAFDYAVAISLFTRLNMNQVARCLAEVKGVLKPDGQFFASFVEAPSPVYLEPIDRGPEARRVTHFDSDPYHYSFVEMRRLAGDVGLEAKLIGDWGTREASGCFAFGEIGET